VYDQAASTTTSPRLTAVLAHRPPAAVQTVSFVAATSWVKAAVHCRLNVEPLFAAAGVAEALGSGLAPQIEPSALARLMEACVAEAAPGFRFPLVAGEMFAFDHLPALETFLTTSNTLRQSLSALGWVSTALPLLDLRLADEDEDSVALLMAPSTVQFASPAAGYFTEMAAAGIHKFAHLLLGDAAQGEYLDLRHDPGEHTALYERVFGLPIRVNQPRNAVVFKRSLLDAPLLGALPGLNQKAQAIVEQNLPAAPSGTVPVAQAVEHWLMREPALLASALDDVAARLHLHPRTLQRQLRQAGMAYSVLRERCRQRLAEESLRQAALDIESLSEQLGFSDRHSFTRAFKRWTGQTPSAWQRQQRGGG
jgi:AraC-like DNA-binding protein